MSIFGNCAGAAAKMADSIGNDPAQAPGTAGERDGGPARAAPRSSVPPALLLSKGYEIGEFRIEGVLGVGGFGITYLALDTRLQRRVALKEYMPETLVAGRDHESQWPIVRNLGDRAQFESFRRRFRDEALQIARFHQPGPEALPGAPPENGCAPLASPSSLARGDPALCVNALASHEIRRQGRPRRLMAGELRRGRKSLAPAAVFRCAQAAGGYCGRYAANCRSMAFMSALKALITSLAMSPG